ncbi:RNA methyltransferase [Caedibacter taeniospiralis]|uniref:RNA methyltransferase n=1 Tax=Caedibacter taeniospiralis TaxID=28907 RepID=UPI000C2750D2|nr:RNA methyltransferase [Caedibacter taeniospiralis]
MLNKIRMVLVETSHPGNIGSSARAMLNMALTELYLVNPKHVPDEDALATAAHAAEIVKNANIVPTLIEALNGVDLVIGTSARVRRMSLPMLSVENASKEALRYANQGLTVAILFGRERTGLFNDELLMCHYHAYIPSNESYTSLNLAQAVQIVSYELFKHFQAYEAGLMLPRQNRVHEKASIEEIQNLYRMLEDKMFEVGFLNPDRSEHVMNRLKRMFQRTQLESKEVNILQGFLSQITKENQ